MIDFRYHVVSLVSVFLALAVGIVLGAGPLKGELGATLNRDVQNLRTQLSEKDAQARTQSLAVDNRDAFTRELIPGLVARQLQGQRVVLVTVPGVDSDVVSPLTDALEDAGATVSGRVDVRSEWVDPGREADRQKLLGTLTAPGDPTPTSTSPVSASTAGAAAGASSASGPARRAAVPSLPVVRVAAPSPEPSVNGATQTTVSLARLLASALLTTDVALSGQAGKGAVELLDDLGKAGMVGVDGDAPGRSDLAVLLVPAVQASGGGAATSPSAAADPAAQWSAIAVALDAAGRGAVVTGPGSSGTSGGVISAVRRQDALTRAVSTVDTGGTPMGDLTTVLALREQLLGGSGRYGFVAPVDGPVPSAAAGS
jgi:hypothetical protein